MTDQVAPSTREGGLRHSAALWPGIALVLLVIAAIAAPLLAPYAPDAIHLASRRGAPSLAHWLGTDELGRDLLARVLFGARISLAIGLFSALIAGAIGVGIGAISGWIGGATDDVLMRLTDTGLAVPRLPLLMILGAILQPSVAMLSIVAPVRVPVKVAEPLSSTPAVHPPPKPAAALPPRQARS